MLYGVVDFHQSCVDPRIRPFQPSGVPIHYFRCGVCRFLFTTAFDHFTTADFQRYIYNSDYVLFDPDYLESRARGKAGFLLDVFQSVKPRTILDYGCGNGALAETLRAAGFPDVDGYDPFVERFSRKRTRRYDWVVAFEVVEHATDPIRVFTEMAELLAEPGMILFSTVVQPPDFDAQGLKWWYVGPRNGHVSLHTRASLECIARRFGLIFGSHDDTLHFFIRRGADFGKQFFVQPDPVA